MIHATPDLPEILLVHITEAHCTYTLLQHYPVLPHVESWDSTRQVSHLYSAAAVAMSLSLMLHD